MSLARMAFVVTSMCLSGFAGAGDDPAQSRPADETAKTANPKALAAYKEGMRLLGGRSKKVAASALNRAEKLFQKAASLDLPEAYYGLACVAYRSGDIERAPQAFAFAKQAAESGVLEAKGLMVSYYFNGYGTQKMPIVGSKLRKILKLRKID